MRKAKMPLSISKVEAFVCYISLPIDETECAKTVFFTVIPMKDGGLGACPKTNVLR